VLAGAEAGVDPVQAGFAVGLFAVDGSPLWRRAVPAGLVAGRTLPGWTVSRAGGKWSYRDPDDLVPDGIVRVVIRRLHDAGPGAYWFKLIGKRGILGLTAGELPRSLQVAFTAVEDLATGPCAGADLAGGSVEQLAPEPAVASCRWLGQVALTCR